MMKTQYIGKIGITALLLATACATKHVEQEPLMDVEEDIAELAEDEVTPQTTKSQTVQTEIAATEKEAKQSTQRKKMEEQNIYPVSPEPEKVMQDMPTIQEEMAVMGAVSAGDVAVDYDMVASVVTTKKSKAKDSLRRSREVKIAPAKPLQKSQQAPVTATRVDSEIATNIVVEKTVIPDTISSGEEYTDYGINPFVSTQEDKLSTFSIDVDTASYTIARRKLNEGKIPNYASVRVEEYINYFDYHYDSSKAEPFVVDMEAMEHPFKSDKHILRVGLQGKELSVENRPPLHLTFLVDVSGSMSSHDKLPLAKESMHLLVDSLRDDDTVALATYAGNISKILDPTYGDDKKQIHAAIDRLNSGGSTAMSSGLDLAYEMAWASFESGAENRVVVLSDGDANVGNTSWQDMLNQIKSYADRGVTMSTIGFGMGNYKDTRMEQLANKGDGNNFYIDSRAQAHRVFVDDFNSSMINIARDVKIQLEFNPEIVESYRLIGYENRDIADKDFRNDRVDAGEIGSGHNVTALYELDMVDSYGDESMATARLRYEKPGADSVAIERSWTVATADISAKRDVSESLKIAFTAGTFAEILRRSPYVSGISLAELIDYGRSAQRRGEKDDVELIRLMQRAEELGISGSFVKR